MADNAKQRREARCKRKARVRKKITGTNQRPRLCVFRSLRFTTAQLISDEGAVVLAAASTREMEAGDVGTGSVASAKLLGGRIAELAKELKIEAVTFDRNGYLYHGRVAAVAEGAREAGLQF